MRYTDNCRYCHRPGCRIESTCATVTGSVMEITVVPLQQYRNYETYVFDLCLSLPERAGTEPVVLSDGITSYELMDTNGQPVTSGKLRGHKRYCLRYGSGGALSSGSVPEHFTVERGLMCMEYSSNPALQEAQ